MTVEERVSDALMEFEELVVEGMSLAKAAALAGANNALRPDVVLKRAVDHLGNLETIAERATLAKTKAARAARVRSEVFEYITRNYSSGPRQDFEDITVWVEARTRFALTNEEYGWAVGQMNDAESREMKRTLGQILAQNEKRSA